MRIPAGRPVSASALGERGGHRRGVLILAPARDLAVADSEHAYELRGTVPFWCRAGDTRTTQSGKAGGLPGFGGQALQADPALLWIGDGLGETAGLGLEPAGLRLAPAGCDAGHGLGGDDGQADAHRDGRDEVLAPAMIGDGTGLHPVIGRRVRRVERLLLLSPRA